MNEIKNRSHLFSQFFAVESWKSLQHEQILETLNQELQARQSLIQQCEQLKNDISQTEVKILEKKNTVKGMLEKINRVREMA